MKFAALITIAALLPNTAYGALPGFNDYSHCSKTTTRKEIHDLTTSEWRTFATTLQSAAQDYATRFINRTALSAAGRQRLTTLEAKTAKKNLSLWEEIAWLHRELFEPIHNNAGFHPWHRKFTADVEKVLQSKASSFFWPYWASQFEWAGVDWGRDAVWGEGRLGRPQPVSSASDSACVKGCPSYLTTLFVPNLIRFSAFNNECLKRYTLLEDVTAATGGEYDFFSFTYYDAVYAQTLTGDDTGRAGWHLFSMAGEAFHSLQHAYIGGNRKLANGTALTGQMGSDISPLDPTFFVHHANVDRIWHQFQENWNALDKPISFQFTGATAPPDPPQNSTFSPNSILTYFNIPAYQAHFASQFCVKYAAPGALAGAKRKREVRKRQGLSVELDLSPLLGTEPPRKWRQTECPAAPPRSWFKLHGQNWEELERRFVEFTQKLCARIGDGSGVSRVFDLAITPLTGLVGVLKFALF
ncbi:hypothetical protein HK097_007349 [Rhizophlyctis rosea]|uniref:Tyrosinase copper-binding domain-containing protein n=1 Tax=Rhizophlyctis rosea TaxID=64517 RepID=A0AAD5SD55_9FUNG|nr:hypothetical protein HK097_007349 [Rhizophlyctis rosea]